MYVSREEKMSNDGALGTPQLRGQEDEEESAKETYIEEGTYKI